MRLARRVLGAAILVVLASACRLEVEINTTVDADGGGTIEVGVGLDDDAIERTADPATLLRTDDLDSTGWTISDPAREAGGLTWVRASKPFGSPAEAARVFAEVAGEDGPFRDFAVAKEDSFAKTTYRFAGTVDFSAGLERFSDPELTDALDGEPLGESIPDIEERFGAVIDELIGLRVAVRMPGDIESNSPSTVTNGAVWSPSVVGDGEVRLVATSETTEVLAYVWVGVAAAAAFAALLILLVRIAARRRPTVTPPE